MSQTNTSDSADQQTSPSHTAFTSLPVVDISGLFSDDLETRKVTAATLDRAARDAGVLYLTGHGIEQHEIDALKASAQLFFSQQDDFKQRSYIGLSENHSGYVPIGEERFYNSDKVDAKEAFDVGFEAEDPVDGKPMTGANLWPDLPGFREGVKPYFDRVVSLSKTLFEGFALGLGLPEDSFTRHLTAPANQLRLIHYFHDPDTTEDAQGIGAHTDYEFFTILLPTSPGLQVLNGAGEWIEVPVIPGAFVVNIGDMMEIITNGNYVATSHRVRKVREERYSFPMFCNLDYDTVVEPLPELCADDAPRYPAVVCGDHLFTQTIHTFRYLQQRVERGELQMPAGAIAPSSFGQSEAGQPAWSNEMRGG